MEDDRAEIRQAVVDTANELFSERVTQSMLEAAETGGFSREFWDEVGALGVPTASLNEEAGGLGSLRDAGALLRPLGYHGVPLPIAETLLANWLASQAGIVPPDGVLSLVTSAGLCRDGDGVKISGGLRNVPWGRYASAVAVLGTLDGTAAIAFFPVNDQITPGRNLAGEPRDRMNLDDVVALAHAPLPFADERVRAINTAMRAAMMAGALERVLDLTVAYAKDRVQFGKPIGKFQAIQQQIAIVANHTAASVMAAERAIAAIEGTDGPKMAAIAKIRVGEGCGESVRIAHQVHGAMGFTHEHILHHFTRRLWSWRDEQGSEAYWARWLGAQAILGGADSLWTFVGETI